MNLLEKDKVKLYDEFFFNFDGEDQKNKEELFRLKLEYLGPKSVKGPTLGVKKQKIRKAQTPIEIIYHYYDIIKPKRKNRPKRRVKSKDSINVKNK